MNGWKNWETWNVSLWIQNDEYLYNVARFTSSYFDLVRRLSALGITETPDGCCYSDEEIDIGELDEMLAEE